MTTNLLPPYQDLYNRYYNKNTPLIELPAPGKNNRIFAKLEYFQHTGSHYDIYFLRLLNRLEEEGMIIQGISTLVESTSGNAGMSCAFIAQQRGYPCEIFLPASLPKTRIESIKQYGATVHEVDGEHFLLDVARALRNFLLEHREEINGVRRCYCPNHSQDVEAPYYFLRIAAEATLQVQEQYGCTFTTFIGAAGNGGTMRGIGTFLRSHSPTMKIVAFEHEACPQALLLRNKEKLQDPPKQHTLYGTSTWGIPFPHLEYNVRYLMNDIFVINDAQWQQGESTLQKLGYEVGHTSSAAYFLACQYCEQHENENVLVLFYDNLTRY